MVFCWYFQLTRSSNFPDSIKGPSLIHTDLISWLVSWVHSKFHLRSFPDLNHPTNHITATCPYSTKKRSRLLWENSKFQPDHCWRIIKVQWTSDNIFRYFHHRMLVANLLGWRFRYTFKYTSLRTITNEAWLLKLIHIFISLIFNIKITILNMNYKI